MNSHIISGKNSGVYTHWGSKLCPQLPGRAVQRIYAGYMVSSEQGDSGGSGQVICLTDTPHISKMGSTQGRISRVKPVSIASDQQSNPLAHLLGNAIECSMCEVQSEPLIIMLPGQSVCPFNWTLQYSGWLMTAHAVFRPLDFTCIDRTSPRTGIDVPGMSVVLDHVANWCTGCAPFSRYRYDQEIQCIVCSK